MDGDLVGAVTCGTVKRLCSVRGVSGSPSLQPPVACLCASRLAYDQLPGWRSLYDGGGTVNVDDGKA